MGYNGVGREEREGYGWRCDGIGREGQGKLAVGMFVHLDFRRSKCSTVVSTMKVRHGVAVLLSPQARAAWEAAGSVFQPASERIIKICLTCATCPTQLSCLFMLLLFIYIHTSTLKVSSTFEAFYD